jgi:FAD/FMN-containing dehydrogenase
LTTELNTEPLDALRAAVRGAVLVAGDAGYDDARHVWNGMIDRHPPLIVRTTGNADVIAAVNYARENGLPVSIKGGGHSAAGTAVSDSALMIDLSLLDGIFVDPKARTARVQGGATWGSFDRECQVHGLARTGGVISTTGVGGLTLGGGFGWLLGKHGLAVDNLISCEVVTATGQLVMASESENADLFWALRGGSGNFGVVTSFEFRLHPVGPIVTGGLAAWPRGDAAGVIDFYKGYIAQTPDDLTAFFVQTGAPDGSGNFICAVIALHAGDLDEGAKLVQPIKEFGPPMLDALGPIPYTAHQSMLDAGFPAGNQVYWKGTFLRELSGGAMDVLVKQGAKLPNPTCGLVLEHFHGALSRVPNDATAFAQRGASFNVAIVSQWQDAAEADGCIAWARETFEALQPYSTGGVYLNYLGVGDDAGRVRDALGTNYDRLATIKEKFDPGNLFRVNQNIAPKG